ncbi:hypothetical protein LZP69_02750 [Shewanella sp. AS1]|uniref:hypothetical protein n=1 Tax=Shewanella sp. AS1 TaxID=2907626 RepID=UPI001F43EC78|nr:hypothetical protein [Shewanella sp. AS1]MCE9678114.1 hypothetical protein [Shewanella sp. AS1]
MSENATDKQAKTEKLTQKLDFSGINKTTAKSFNEQKNLIKRLFKGNTVLCDVCRQPLQLVVPVESDTEGKYGVFCKKGCTDIELEMEAVL